MKILYALQATGNGHISRANTLIPIFEKYAETDVLLSGTQADVSLNQYIKYRCKGVGFVFGEKGGIDFKATFKNLETKKFLKEIENLPVENYDLVINDFEPVSAWACLRKKVPCIALSHQFALTNQQVAGPEKISTLAAFILNKYAPCKSGYGFHFTADGPNIFTPIIRDEIRKCTVLDEPHYTVYLPAYSNKKIIKVLERFPGFKFHVFTKHGNKAYREGNCWVRPINNFDFAGSLSSGQGIICGAGFETPAEAIFLNKKLLVVPMKNQFEQQFNAAALHQLGVGVLKKFNLKRKKKIAKWLSTNHRIHIDYKDQNDMIVRRVLGIDTAAKVIPALNGHTQHAQLSLVNIQ